jgi:p-aminobenzoyl-glutamate transporter AbgT
MGVMLFLVAHLVYGMIAGAIYKHSSVAGVP